MPMLLRRILELLVSCERFKFYNIRIYLLEIKFVRQNLSAVQTAMAARGHHAELDTFKKRDDEHRIILKVIESLLLYGFLTVL